MNDQKQEQTKNFNMAAQSPAWHWNLFDLCYFKHNIKTTKSVNKSAQINRELPYCEEAPGLQLTVTESS